MLDKETDLLLVKCIGATSAGMCTVYIAKNDAVQVDIGMPYLNSLTSTLLITHDHSDHIGCLKQLKQLQTLGQPKVKVYREKDLDSIELFEDKHNIQGYLFPHHPKMETVG
jgi:phosphoribosyl 1,2-cyclic phosphodiesterase